MYHVLIPEPVMSPLLGKVSFYSYLIKHFCKEESTLYCLMGSSFSYVCVWGVGAMGSAGRRRQCDGGNRLGVTWPHA